MCGDILEKLILLILTGIISPRNCQTWAGCNGNYRHLESNCLPQGTNGKTRCFCFHDDLDTWDAADQICNSSYNGQLAVDDSYETHRVLSNMVANINKEDYGPEQAWIGGRTQPLYWNWMATNANRNMMLMAYQGCFKTGEMEENKTIFFKNNLKENCRNWCDRSNFTYFALREDNASGYECSCGNHFVSRKVVDECKQVNVDDEDTGWAGSKNSVDVKGVYFTHAEARFTNWVKSQPRGIDENKYCLQYYGQVNKRLSWVSENCDSTSGALLICVKGQLLGCDTESYEGDCMYTESNQKLSQPDAVRKCAQYGGSLPSVYSSDIDKCIKRIRTNIGNNLEVWTAGTNLRWVWLTEREVSDAVLPNFWLNNKEDFPFYNHCMSIDSHLSWVSFLCSEQKKYICETMVHMSETTPRQTFTKILLSSGKASTDLTSSVRFSSVFARTSPSTNADKTSKPATQGEMAVSSDNQLPMVAGATGGALLFVVLLTVMAVLLLRHFRQKHDEDSGNSSSHLRNELHGTNYQHFYQNMASQAVEYDNLHNNLSKEMQMQPARPNSSGDLKCNNLVTQGTDSSGHKFFKDGDMLMVNNEVYEASHAESLNPDFPTGVKTVKTCEIEMVENDMYDSRDKMKCKETADAPTIGQDSNFPSYNKQHNIVLKSTEMIENEIYFSSKNNATELEPVMVENEIYVSTD